MPGVYHLHACAHLVSGSPESPPRLCAYVASSLLAQHSFVFVLAFVILFCAPGFAVSPSLLAALIPLSIVLTPSPEQAEFIVGINMCSDYRLDTTDLPGTSKLVRAATTSPVPLLD